MKSNSKVFKALFGGLVILLLVFALPGQARAEPAFSLAPGDIVVADTNGDTEYNKWAPGRIIKVEPSGTQSVIASGGYLNWPFDVAIDLNGNVIVLDKPGPWGNWGSDRIIKVEPSTGNQSVIASGGSLINSTGITVDAFGNLLVADSQEANPSGGIWAGPTGPGAIIKINPVTGDQTIISSGGYLTGISDLDLDSNGDIFAQTQYYNKLTIVKIDPSTGSQTLISWGPNTNDKGGIAVDDGNIYASRISWRSTGDPSGLIKVDAATGIQTFLTSFWLNNWGVDVDLSGYLVVSVNNWAWQGYIVRVDPSSGAKTTITSGGYLADPYGVTIYPPVAPPNRPPTANANGPYMVHEGGSVQLSGSGNDPDGDPLTYAWDLDYNGSFETPGQNPTFSAAGRDGPGSQTVVLRVYDGEAYATSTATVNISNVVPVITSVTGPAEPLAVNTGASVTVYFTDAGTMDTHNVIFSWGDSSQDTTVQGSAGSATATHTYTAAGVYTVGVTVTDDDSGSATSSFQFVTIYDSSAGFVTGGGWINSPAGAYTAQPTLTGKATFGFVSKYQKGANVPTGETQFQFRVANLNFHSSNYEWLVVAGARAQYKGSGTINGAGDYGFMLTAIDGQISGGGGTDKFRIKIWDKTASAIVYDNQMGKIDTGYDATQLGGGSIVIHN